MEIEKKYRLFNIPTEIDLEKGKEIIPGYIFIRPFEMRLRLKGTQYFLTIKSEGNTVREEWESEVPEWVFKKLWGKTRGRRIYKTRYNVNYGKYLLEIDVFHKKLEGLILLECEFSSTNEMITFQLPKLGTNLLDVTNDPKYKNRQLALNGIPDIN